MSNSRLPVTFMWITFLFFTFKYRDIKPMMSVAPMGANPVRAVVFNAVPQQKSNMPQLPGDVFQSSLKANHTAVRFGGGNFKQLVKEFKRFQPLVDKEAQQTKAAEFALKLFKACPSERELLDFAKQVGIVVHPVDINSPLGQWMQSDCFAQGLAIYPHSKIIGLSKEAQDFYATRREIKENGFEILSECEKNKKPLILIRTDLSNNDFSLYVLQHELFHIIQQTLGNVTTTSSNYYNEGLAFSWHTDLLRKLSNRNTEAAKEVIKRAEENKQYLSAEEKLDTFGQALRHISSLDLQTYGFFCDNAAALKLPAWLKAHNERLREKYEIIKLYSYSPDLNTGLSSIEMRRS